MEPPTESPKLLQQLRQVVQLRHYSPRTEQAYVAWVRRFVRFYGLHHPAELGAAEITRFLGALAEQGRLSASSQTQALSALLFLYKEVLHRDLGGVGEVVRAKQPVRLPVVLTRDEVRGVLAGLTGAPQLVARMMYGSGLRLLEALGLRVKDLDLPSHEIRVRRPKGGKDRVTMLADSVVNVMEEHLAGVRRLHRRDLAAGVAALRCPMRSRGRHPAPARSGVGSLSSLLCAVTWTRDRRIAPAPSARVGGAAGREGCGPCVRSCQASHLPQFSSFVRHSPPARRVRHSDRAGAVGPPRRGDHDDLYPCSQSWRAGGPQPSGSAVMREHRQRAVFRSDRDS
jgi:hypothetical protein